MAGWRRGSVMGLVIFSIMVALVSAPVAVPAKHAGPSGPVPAGASAMYATMGMKLSLVSPGAAYYS